MRDDLLFDEVDVDLDHEAPTAAVTSGAESSMPYCKIHKRRHRLCAVCHETNRTMALCSTCRADPVNRDWNPRSIARDRQMVEGIEEVTPAGDRIAELRDRRARSASLIRQQVLALLRDYQIREPRRPRGRRRYVVEWEWERRPLHVVEVAFLLDRDPKTIREILASVEERLLRPVLAHAAERSAGGSEGLYYAETNAMGDRHQDHRGVPVERSSGGAGTLYRA